MDERLLREIQKSNPWWIKKKESLPPYKRTVFTTLVKYLETRHIIAIVGLRRVGKTTLMKQLIEHTQMTIQPENIFFFTFEEQWGKTEILEDILYYFLETKATTTRKLILLDEIQKVPGWEEILKRFYDRYPDIKFIVSGSASLRISQSIESLAGRIFDVYVTPLSFFEFIELNNVRLQTAAKTEIYETCSTLYQNNLFQKEKLIALFNEYLFKGGFPEIATETSEEVIHKYITNSVIERIILKDLPEEYAIKNIAGLRGILEYAAKETSKLFIYDTLASTLGLNKETVSNYIEYLKRAFLLHVFYNYTSGAEKQLRTSKKLHFVLPSVALSMESYDRNILHHPEIMGKYIESLLAVFLSYTYKNIWFWRTPQKDEVDIIIKDDHLLPIEVKYQTQIHTSDVKTIVKFCKKHNVQKGVIITKDVFDKHEFDGITVEIIPAWVFLLYVQIADK